MVKNDKKKESWSYEYQNRICKQKYFFQSIVFFPADNVSNLTNTHVIYMLYMQYSGKETVKMLW